MSITKPKKQTDKEVLKMDEKNEGLVDVIKEVGEETCKKNQKYEVEYLKDKDIYSLNIKNVYKSSKRGPGLRVEEETEEETKAIKNYKFEEDEEGEIYLLNWHDKKKESKELNEAEEKVLKKVRERYNPEEGELEITRDDLER